VFVGFMMAGKSDGAAALVAVVCISNMGLLLSIDFSIDLFCRCSIL
jgi:hypothetical protein